MQGPERVELSDGRLVLRPWRPEDVPRVAEICSDREISRWTTVPWPYTEDHARSWIEQTIRDWDRREGEAAFAVADAATGVVLGAIGLRLNRDCEGVGSVGYWVAAEARGGGVATGALRLVRRWAFEELGLRRLELVTLPGNIASQRVAEKAGFRRKRLLRRHLEHHGEARDCVLFSAPSDALRDVEGGTVRS
jgi:RimJ/RimL family protein N-acetyltransferase